LDQPVVLLLREHGSHVEHVLKHRLLKLPLRTMDFLHGVSYAFGFAFIRQQCFGQLPIRFSNRREQFIPAPSEFGLNRLQIPFLFGAKTQLAVNPVMIIDRPCHGLAQEVIADIKSDRSDERRAAGQKAGDEPRPSRLLVRIGQAQVGGCSEKTCKFSAREMGRTVLAF
jgi:hypothetical protein